MLAAGLAVAACLAVGISPAAAAGGTAQGSGTVEGYPHCALGSTATFAFSASAGQTVSGTFSFSCSATASFPSNTFEGSVSCLVVNGTAATLGGTITQSNKLGFPVGLTLSFNVLDAGPAGAGDGLGVMYENPCLVDPTFQTIATGDIVVAAAPPPTATIATQATPSATVGSPISDTAVVTGGDAPAPAPTGTVTFTLYGPDDATCTGTPVFTSAARPLTGGPPPTATSEPFTPTVPGSYQWVATYSGDATYPPATGVCGAADETTIVTAATADLGVTKDCAPGPVLPGAVVPCSITVTNHGPATADQVLVTDDLPAGETLVATPTGGGFSCTTGDPFTCQLASLTPGAPATITYSVVVGDAVAPGSSLVNQVSVSSATPEAGPQPNSATAATSVVACTITGAGDILGTNGADVICGSAGADRISGLGGNDTIHAGAGNDRVQGGQGDDLIVPGPGTDQAYGEAGDDRILLADGTGGDYALGGTHVSGDTCTGDAGDLVAQCSP